MTNRTWATQGICQILCGTFKTEVAGRACKTISLSCLGLVGASRARYWC